MEEESGRRAHLKIMEITPQTTEEKAEADRIREIKRKVNARLKGEFFAVGIRKGHMSHEAAEAIVAAIARGEFPELSITYPIQGEKT